MGDDTPPTYPVLSEPWLGHLTSAVRYSTLTEWGHAPRSSCVPTIRVMLATCAYFGIKARPLAVGVRVQSLLDPNTVAGIFGTGDLDPDTGSWDGHMIAILAGRYLADPAADQHAYPEHGIPGSPWVFEVDPAPLLAGEGVQFHNADDGTTVGYQLLAKQGTWRTMAWWYDWKPQAKRATARAINYMRSRTA